MTSLNELKEIAYMAKRDNRLDILEQVESEIAEMNQSNLLELTNEYTETCPLSQIMSNHLNNLINTYGRDKLTEVLEMFNYIEKQK